VTDLAGACRWQVVGSGGYNTLARSGDTIGIGTFALVVDQNGDGVYEHAAGGAKTGTLQIADSPDFTSILEVGGNIFSITQFEQARVPSPYSRILTHPCCCRVAARPACPV
jgi:flagellar basal body rod protein FlgG